MNTERAYYLLEQYYHQRITNVEKEELARIADTYDEQTLIHLLSELMRRNLSQSDRPVALEDLQPYVDEIINIDKTPGIVGMTPTKKPARKRSIYKWTGWAAAALIILLFSVYKLYRSPSPKTDTTTIADADVQPGKNGAILTLSDGSRIVLDSMGNGMVKNQDGAVIEVSNGQVHYLSDQKKATTTLYNTMTTPKGRNYKLVLADGTKVWLNAASSITYPIAFTSGERKVSMSGEAYFEVSKMPHKPFNVSVGSGATVIKVLGTHFNINAYTDEPTIKTTLLEGEVKVTVNERARFLKPGQQAETKPGSSEINIENQPDLLSAVAWKDNYFSFVKADLQMVMREMARWYDLTVVYQGKVPEGTFSGKIGRNLTLRQVLNLLETTNIRYKITSGNKIEIASQ